MNTTEVTETICAVLALAGLIATLAHLGVIEGSWSWSLKLVPRYKRDTPPPTRKTKAAAGTVPDSDPVPDPAVPNIDRRAAAR